jgi:[ribosomal protein S5]-alanine N-acetyltransferase
MFTTFHPFPTLTTERTVLRRLEESDALAIYNYQSNKENFPYVDMPVYKHLDEAKEYIAKMNKGVSLNNWIIWAITLKTTHEIIGTISVWNLNIEEEKAEYAYGIFPAHRRNGYMLEALEAVNTYSLKVMNLKTIEAYTSHYNQPSIQFLSHAGFTFVETIEDDYSDGALMDVFKLEKR